ncbi:MAG: cupin-like domain-containing protein, partial [Myxococcota bacterium]
RLRRAVAAPGIAERTALDEAALYETFWTANRPVVLRGAACAWPAAGWTHAGLAERFSEVSVEVLTGRSRERWWVDRAPLRTRIPFGDLMAACLGPPSDDLYSDGRTELLAQPGLEPLRAELGTLPGLVGDGIPRTWIGPAGTVTPTHHDQSTGWLVQLVGAKRVWMASPLEAALMTTADGVYNRVDPRAPSEGELREVRWDEVELRPGDALLVPVGWWHQVVALSPSISVSFGGFRWPNRFDWYTPGRG